MQSRAHVILCFAAFIAVALFGTERAIAFNDDLPDPVDPILVAQEFELDDNLSEDERRKLSEHVQTQLASLSLQRQITFDDDGGVKSESSSINLRINITVDEEQLHPLNISMQPFVVDAFTNTGENLRLMEHRMQAAQIRHMIDTPRPTHQRFGRHHAHQDHTFRLTVSLAYPELAAQSIRRLSGVAVLQLGADDPAEVEIGPIEELLDDEVELDGFSDYGKIAVNLGGDGVTLEMKASLGSQIQEIEFVRPDGSTYQSHGFSSSTMNEEHRRQYRIQPADGSMIRFRMLPDIKHLLVPFEFDDIPLMEITPNANEAA